MLRRARYGAVTTVPGKIGVTRDTPLGGGDGAKAIVDVLVWLLYGRKGLYPGDGARKAGRACQALETTTAVRIPL